MSNRNPPWGPCDAGPMSAEEIEVLATEIIERQAADLRHLRRQYSKAHDCYMGVVRVLEKSGQARQRLEAELAEARSTLQALAVIDATPVQMSKGDGRLLPVNAEGMRTLVDELAEAKRENFKLAAGQCLHELKGDEFGNAYCSRIHELETELSEAKAQRRGAWKSGRDRERQNSIDLRNKLADCERERNALRADLERASEKIEKQNTALLRVYTLEDENNALKADIERVRAWIARSVGEAMNDDGTELWIIEWPKLTENPMADREASMERNDG